MISAGFKAAAVLLIGDAAGVCPTPRAGWIFANEIVETMEQAVLRAPELAKQYQVVVLLSPACASLTGTKTLSNGATISGSALPGVIVLIRVEGWVSGNRRSTTWVAFKTTGRFR